MIGCDRNRAQGQAKRTELLQTCSLQINLSAFGLTRPLTPERLGDVSNVPGVGILTKSTYLMATVQNQTAKSGRNNHMD